MILANNKQLILSFRKLARSKFLWQWLSLPLELANLNWKFGSDRNWIGSAWLGVVSFIFGEYFTFLSSELLLYHFCFVGRMENFFAFVSLGCRILCAASIFCANWWKGRNTSQEEDEKEEEKEEEEEAE